MSSFKILIYMLTRTLYVCVFVPGGLDTLNWKLPLQPEIFQTLYKKSPRLGRAISERVSESKREERERERVAGEVWRSVVPIPTVTFFLNGRVIRLVCNYSVFKFNKDSHYRKNREVEIMECREAWRRRKRGQRRPNRVFLFFCSPQFHSVWLSGGKNSPAA